MQVADQPPVVDLAHDEFDRVERGGFARLVEHRQEDAGQKLHHQHDHGDEAKEVPDVEVLRRVVAGGLSFDELLDRQTLEQPSLETLALYHQAAPYAAALADPCFRWSGGGALYTEQCPAFGHVNRTLA